jgi:hypothetical protein
MRDIATGLTQESSVRHGAIGGKLERLANSQRREVEVELADIGCQTIQLNARGLELAHGLAIEAKVAAQLVRVQATTHRLQQRGLA